MEIGGCYSTLQPEEERKIVEQLTSESEKNVNDGNLFYVISNRWYKSWQRYVGLSTDECSRENPSEAPGRPGPISNIDIIENGTDSSEPQIRRLLEEGVDYVLVPAEVWKRLLGWYNVGPALPRKLISQGLQSKSYSVEVYPLCLRLNDQRDESVTIVRLSKQASVSELYVKVCKLKGVQKEKARIWDYFNKQKGTLLVASSDKSLEESFLSMDQDILLELDERSLNVHSPSSPFEEDSENSASNVVVDGDDATKEERGLAGLQNLGYTCFMNSALQCLAHTPPIMDYFLQNYSHEVNTDNPLGMHGDLALAFGFLLRRLWSSKETVEAPHLFQGKIARFAHQFSGRRQHDSQELLAFLLDGLHEDLNRVRRKPYIEFKAYDGRPDEKVADQSWENHKARNDSVIVDVCQGQYKSTLVCPVCRKISITFDPFMYLSLPLPLPSADTRSITATVIYSDGSRPPTSYTVTVPKAGYTRDFIVALSTACCLNSDESLLITEIYEHKIGRYYSAPNESLLSIHDEDTIVAYRYIKKESETVQFEVYHTRQKAASEITDETLFGVPLMTFVNNMETLTGADVDGLVSRLLSPLQRAHSSSKAPAVKENMSSDGSSLMVTDMEDATDKVLRFKLFSADYLFSSLVPINAESLLLPLVFLKIVVVWTDSDDQVYDASYLKDIPKVDTGLPAEKINQETFTLFECLEKFLAEEPLGPDDLWHCNRCKEYKQANKKLDLWKLPDILVIHLKRFMFKKDFTHKLCSYVDFPIHDLDLTKYVKRKDGQSYLYNLYAVNNHYGGQHGGHYTAYAKLIDKDEWYRFDDGDVSPIDEFMIPTSAAYMLFYQRVKAGSKDCVGETPASGLDS